MAIILGIDPGSRITGYGVINAVGAKLEYIASGCIRLPDASIPERLNTIFNCVTELIESYSPQMFAIEQVFLGKNVDSALKLGQARGAAIVAAGQAGLDVSEYSARTIKQNVAGIGSADKLQMQHMVQRLLKLPGLPQSDAADGLAIAICHAHTQQSLVMQAGVRGVRKGRLR